MKIGLSKKYKSGWKWAPLISLLYLLENTKNNKMKKIQVDFYCVAWTNRLLGEYIIIVYTLKLMVTWKSRLNDYKVGGFYLNRTFCSRFSYVLYLLKFLFLFYIFFFFKKSFMFLLRDLTFSFRWRVVNFLYIYFYAKIKVFFTPSVAISISLRARDY